MRDHHTGEALVFRPIFKRSDGFAQVQAERGRAKKKRPRHYKKRTHCKKGHDLRLPHAKMNDDTCRICKYAYQRDYWPRWMQQKQEAKVEAP